MITPQQKQAWREEYLEEMRKISKEIYPLEGRDESDEIDLDNRLILFFVDVLIPLINATGYVFQNFPLVAAQIDEEQNLVKEEDRLPLTVVFDYLITMSQYGRDIVLSEFPNHEPLLQAVSENDKDRFLGLVRERNLDFSSICLRIGYVNGMLLTLHTALSYCMGGLVSEAYDEEEEQYIEEQMNSVLERIRVSCGEEAIKQVTINEQMKSVVLGCSTLDIQSLDGVFQSLYTSFLPLWFNQMAVVYGHFMDEETAIIKAIIENLKYQDIIDDLKRLAYIIYDFPGYDLYEVKNIAELDTLKENLHLN